MCIITTGTVMHPFIIVSVTRSSRLSQRDLPCSVSWNLINFCTEWMRKCMWFVI